MSSVIQANVTIQGSITTLGTFGQTTYAPVDLGVNSLSLATGNLTSLITTSSSAPTGFAAAGEGSLVFSGTANSYIQLNNTSITNGNIYSYGDFLIEAWVNPVDLSNNPTIFAVGPAAGLQATQTWVAIVQGGYLYFINGMNGANQVIYGTNGGVALGSWTHIAVIYQAATARIQLYINGQPQPLTKATATNITVSGTVATFSAWPASLTTNYPLSIGQSYTSGVQYNGSLTNLRITTGSGAAQIYNNNAFTPSTSPLFPASNTAGGSLTTRLLVRVPLATNKMVVPKLGGANTNSVLAFPPAPMTGYATNMTGQSYYGQGTYVASASSEVNSSYLAWYAFNKTPANSWSSAGNLYNSSTGIYTGSVTTVDMNGAAYAGEWVQVQLPVSLTLSSYVVQMRGDAGNATGEPKTWWILGSRDGTSWFLVDQRSNITWNGASSTNTLTANASTAFSFFRCVTNVIGAAVGAQNVAIGEWTLNGTIEGPSISPDGRLGVGVSNPVQALEVAGSAVVGGTLSAGNPLMFRNAIINGDMRINQRGISTNWASPTAVGAVTGGIYATDRWNVYRGSYQTGAAVAQGTLAITDQPYKDGLQYYLRVGRVSGDTGTNLVDCQCNMESRDSYRFAGQPVTLSFYYRTGSGLSGSATAALDSGTATDQAARNGITGGVNLVTQTLVASNAWQRASFTGFSPANSSQLIVSFLYTPSGTAGGFDYFDITGVQLEKGTVATPFEVRPYGVELALCQRYYVRFTGDGSYKPLGTAYVLSATSCQGVIVAPTSMRTQPSTIDISSSSNSCAYSSSMIQGTTVNTTNDVYLYSGASTNYGFTTIGGTGNGVASLSWNLIGIMLGGGAGGLTAGWSGMLYMPTGKYIGFSAEL